MGDIPSLRISASEAWEVVDMAAALENEFGGEDSDFVIRVRRWIEQNAVVRPDELKEGE